MKEFFITRIVAFFAALIISLGILWSMQPEPEIVPKDEITDSETVRVMSFNIRCLEYSRRKKIVPQLIKEYAPDSLGIQECTYQWYNNLAESLTDYEFIGVGRDTGDRSAVCGEMSAILYKKDKFNLVDSGTFWVSETPDKVSQGWDGACRRICTWVILENKETGEQYAHVNTHLDHEGAEARVKGSQMVEDFALSFDMPTVLTGDFNFRRDTDLYEGMVDGGLRDVQAIAKDTMDGKTYHDYKGGTEGSPIDYILVNDQVTDVLRYKIVREKYSGKYTSDHYPIYSDVKF